MTTAGANIGESDMDSNLGTEMMVGDRVRTRRGARGVSAADRDTGVLCDPDMYPSIPEGCVLVAWDSGVTTPCDPDDLETV